MKYKVTEKLQTQCAIELIPENDIEQKLLTQISEETEFTFLHHYQAALHQHVNRHATYVHLLNNSNYPKKVTVQFQNSKGIGE